LTSKKHIAKKREQHWEKIVGSTMDASTQLLRRRMLLLTIGAFATNIPLGWYRTQTEKFSPEWFLAIHASVPFIVLLRKRWNMPKRVIPVNILGAVMGQLLGSQLKETANRRNAMERSLLESRGADVKET
jgi:hypothetical protein